MDPGQIKAWCAAILAVGAVVAGSYKVVDARAQDAARETAATEAAAQVEQRMRPVEQNVAVLVKQNKELIAQGRRKEDRELRDRCEDKEHQDLTPEARKTLCAQESELRWRAWAAQDSAAADPR